MPSFVAAISNFRKSLNLIFYLTDMRHRFEIWYLVAFKIDVLETLKKIVNCVLEFYLTNYFTKLQWLTKQTVFPLPQLGPSLNIQHILSTYS